MSLRKVKRSESWNVRLSRRRRVGHLLRPAHLTFPLTHPTRVEGREVCCCSDVVCAIEVRPTYSRFDGGVRTRNRLLHGERLIPH